MSFLKIAFLLLVGTSIWSDYITLGKF